MERRLARTRPVEEEPGLTVQGPRQVLECEPPGLGEWAIEPSPPERDVVTLRQGEARSETDPGVGDGQRDRGAGARPHSWRCRATLHRSERRVVGVARRTGAVDPRNGPQLRRAAPLDTRLTN